VESCEVEVLVSLYGRVLSGDDSGCRQKKERFVWTWLRPERQRCRYTHCIKHPERTHVKLRGEASLRRRRAADSIRGSLYYFSSELAFPGYAVECLS
jgi:hypothetical protein